MVLDHAKLGCAFTFIKDLARVFSLSFLPKTLIWNKMVFLASNLLKLAEMVVNQLKTTISKNNYEYSFLYAIFTAYCKYFMRL